MSADEVGRIASELWGWEITRLIEIAKLRHPTSHETTAPGRALREKLVQVRMDANDTLGTVTLTWEATDLGRQVAERLSRG